MSIYWLMAAIATTTPVGPPIVNSSPMMTVDVPMPNKTPPKGQESSAIAKGDPGTWAGSLDYPSLALMEQREGTTGFRLTVNTEGRVSDCAIVSSSGHADLDKATCDRVTVRAAFYPAQDKQGQPTVGHYSNRIRWQIPSISTTASMPIQSDSFPKAPQLRNRTVPRIAEEDYPQTAKAALQQGLAVLSLDIDNTGTVSNCLITRSTTFLDLDKQSCSLALKWQFDPARNLAGEPVAGRTSHSIHWRLPGKPPGATGVIAGPRFNPFEKAGEMTATLDFAKDGKLINCEFEHKGDLPGLANRSELTDNVCKNYMLLGAIKPFVDVAGNPQARRVITTVSIKHADTPVATSDKP